MACLSRAANREKYPKVQRLAYSIDELCVAADVSRSFYERMKRAGKGPEELRLADKTIRITRAAAKKWLQALAAANRSDADTAETEKSLGP
jgi:hypothetical protein